MAGTYRATSCEAQEDKKGQIVATVTGFVEFPNQDVLANRTDSLAALNVSGIPQRGDYYVYNNTTILNLICQERTAKQRGTQHPGIFDVTIRYSNDNTLEGDINPLARPSKYSYGFEQFQKAMNVDLAGTPIKNTADDPFTDTVEVDDSRPLIKVVRNEPYFNSLQAETFQDATNAAAVTINGRSYAARTLKMRSISGEPQKEMGIDFYVVTYDLVVRREGWKLKLASTGYRSYDEITDEGYPCPVRDSRGVIVPNESFLDADGFATQSPYEMEFVVYKEKYFSDLAL